MTAFLDFFAQRKKAIAGLLSPGIGLFVADVGDGNWPTQTEWRYIAIACLVGAVGVHYAPANKPAPIEGD